jgi:hypothetical protein
LHRDHKCDHVCAEQFRQLGCLFIFGTAVELTHSGWEQLGDAAASLRERYDRGWGTVFERHFVDYANSAAT